MCRAHNRSKCLLCVCRMVTLMLLSQASWLRVRPHVQVCMGPTDWAQTPCWTSWCLAVPVPTVWVSAGRLQTLHLSEAFAAGEGCLQPTECDIALWKIVNGTCCKLLCVYKMLYTRYLQPAFHFKLHLASTQRDGWTHMLQPDLLHS